MVSRFERESNSLPYPTEEVIEDIYTIRGARLEPPEVIATDQATDSSPKPEDVRLHAIIEVPIYAIPVPEDSAQKVQRYAREHYTLLDPDVPTHEEVAQHFAESLKVHNKKIQEEDTHLRDHQQKVFDDIAKFFETGETAGYVQLPTGTGKTVLFVELCQALVKNAPLEYQPRILVVTPTKDLVHQTVGKQGKKGFGGFGGDLQMATYFSDSRRDKDSSVQDSVKGADVCITTYKSFGQMFDTDLEGDFKFSYQPKKGDYKHARTRKKKFTTVTPGTHKVIDLFDLVIFDEGHHLLGESNLAKLDRLKNDNIPTLAFTATPDRNPNRRLSDALGPEIHAMGIREAIKGDLLAPLISFGVESGATIGTDAVNHSTGEYNDEALTNYLGFHEERNDEIVQSAKILIEAGLAPVVSCLAGKDLYHPNHIARLLNETVITDPVTGIERFARVAAVDSATSTKERAKILQDYEEGTIDSLTFINILGEGWDSQRAKALVNARPTRSKIFGQQRLGRILRSTPDNQAGVVVDIVDKVSGDKVHIPAVNTSDLLQYTEYTLKAGAITAADGIASEDLQRIQDLSQKISRSLEAADLRITALSKDFSIAQMYAQYFTGGEASGSSGEFTVTQSTSGDAAAQEEVITYATLPRIEAKQLIVGLNEQIVDKLEALRKDKYKLQEKKVGFKKESFLNVREIQQDIDTLLPLVNPEKYVVAADGQKWASARAFNKLLSKHFSWANEDIILDILHGIDEEAPADVSPPSMLGRFIHRYHAGTGKAQYGVAELFPLETYKQVAKKLQAILREE